MSGVFVYGKHISKDKNFRQLLKDKPCEYFSGDINQLEKALATKDAKLLVYEFSESWEDDLINLKILKASIPLLDIIVIDDGSSRDAIIRSFRSGIKDYFKKPYNVILLAERVEALMKAMNEKSDWNDDSSSEKSDGLVNN